MKTALFVAFCASLALIAFDQADAYCCRVDDFPIGHPPSCNIFGCNCECSKCVGVGDIGCCMLDTIGVGVCNKSRKRRDLEHAKLFKSVDQNGDGAVSMDEAVAYLVAKWNMTESELRSAESQLWFHELDLNGDGKLQPREVDAAF